MQKGPYAVPGGTVQNCCFYLIFYLEPTSSKVQYQSVFIGSFGGRGMEENGFCVVSQRPRERTNHVKRSMHFDRDECLICLIDCKCHYRITHASSTPRDTGYWTLSLLYFRYCHNALHCTHVPSNFLCIK